MLIYVRSWLPIAVAVTGLCGFIYAGSQQVYRQSFNNPQIQLSEDTAAHITAGVTPAAAVGKDKINIATSLAPFVIVYDGGGKPVASSGFLDSQIPVPPPGVFVYTSNNGDDRLTLEPLHGVRIAAVVTALPQGKGFVLAGRNMRVIEQNISDLGNMILLGWLIIMVATFIAVLVAKRYLRDGNGYVRMSL